MKIALIAPENLPVPPVLGGAIPQTLYETVQAIHKPHLCVIGPWHNTLKSHDKITQGKFYHVNIQHEKQKIAQTLSNHNPQGLDHTDEAHQFYYLNGITDLLNKIAPDIIQVHNRPQYVPYLRKQFPQIPIILYLHNEPNKFDSNLRDAVNKSDHLIFVSQFLQNLYHRFIPSSQNKSTCIYNSVNTHRWHPSLKDTPYVANLRARYHLEPKQTILFSGRLVYKKGLTYLLDAMKQVLQKMPSTKLLIVGSPFFKSIKNSPFLTHLKQKAQPLGNAIIFTGYVDYKYLPNYYAAADITVVPSLYREAFCKVVAESMAIGIPVIGSNRGALPELIDHNKNGYLIDNPRNPEALAHQILTLLQQKEHLEELGKNARHKITQYFNHKTRIKMLCKFYNQVEFGQHYLKKRSHTHAA